MGQNLVRDQVRVRINSPPNEATLWEEPKISEPAILFLLMQGETKDMMAVLFLITW